MYGPVAQWIRHLTTNQGIPGSNPGGVDYFSPTYKNLNALKISDSFKMQVKSLFSE